MKKVLFVVALVTILGSAGSAIAAIDATSTAAQFDLKTIATESKSKDVIFGLSPKVVARYVNPGDSSVTSQWYAIGTAHPGGTTKYGTAQDLNNIYSAPYITGTAIDNTVLNIQETSASTSAWTDAGWELK